MKIHPTAIIDKSAEIAENVEIGPYVIIEPFVKIGKGTKIASHSVIKKWVKLGENNIIHSGAVLGDEPQDIKYKNEESYVIIGNNNIIREFVTIHRATDKNGVTKIGNNNFIMAYAHIAHNCILGNEITIANFAGLSGCITVEDKAFISGLSAIHQFTKIGTLSMIGGGSKINKDVPPYTMVDGNPVRVIGLNIVGLKRNGLSNEEISVLAKSHKIIFNSELNIKQAEEKILKELKQTEAVKHLLEFINRSERGIIKK